MACCGKVLKWSLGVTSVLVVALAVGIAQVQRTVWWAGYDLQNCPGCRPLIPWSDEFQSPAVSSEHVTEFTETGVTVLRHVLSVDKISQLAHHVDELPTTVMTDGLAKFTLPHYLKYEHRLDTRSELVRDWAVHGPLGKWAAELLNVTHVRLYNAEAIYHAGTPCKPAWHRDTIAAPFDSLTVRSVTLNVYFDDIAADGPHGDALIYMSGSHLNMDNTFAHDETDATQLIRPVLHVGDVLAHDPNVYHTPSGQACWHRRSMQFRYVSAKNDNGLPTTFEFGPNRLPHGPIPWTLAHAPGIAPHGLVNGDVLQGPWYPQVYPSVLDMEHVALSNAQPWSLVKVLKLAKEAEQAVRSPTDPTRTVAGSFALDGTIVHPDEWIFQEIAPGSGVEVPCHKHGLFAKHL
jgi:hypothetical protein